MEPLHELRAFVCNGRVTAVSQYYQTCIVESLVEQQDLIKQLVCKATTKIHEEMLQLLPEVNYTE